MGYSNGGGFAYDLACRLNDKITGIGAVARTMYAESYAECTVTHPTPVVTILGTDDFNSNYNGVTYEGTLYYHSSQSTHDLWIEENGLNSTAEMTAIPDVNAGDNTYVELYQWRDEQNCREVSHYKVIRGGHDWPGTFGNMDIVSHEVIWDHLKTFEHGWSLVMWNQRHRCASSPRMEPLPQPWDRTRHPGVVRLRARATSCQVYNASGQLLKKRRHHLLTHIHRRQRFSNWRVLVEGERSHLENVGPLTNQATALVRFVGPTWPQLQASPKAARNCNKSPAVTMPSPFKSAWQDSSTTLTWQLPSSINASGS